MSEHVSTERMNDAMDGLLSSVELERLEAHVNGCTVCRQEYARLSEIIEAMRALPKTASPPAEAWSTIAQRIAGAPAGKPESTADVVRLPTAGRARRLFTFSLPQLAAAAMIVALVSASMVWLSIRQPTGVRSLERVTAGSPTGPAARAVSNTRYLEVVGELQALLAEGRATLAPETLEVIEGSLQTVDAAIEEVETALAQDPNSEMLLRMLAAHQKTKLGVLQRAAEAVRSQT